MKRLGSGPKGADEIKEHPFFACVNWDEAAEKKLKVPAIPLKKVVKENIPIDKVYGKGAFDENLKDINRINQWTFIKQ